MKNFLFLLSSIVFIGFTSCSSSKEARDYNRTVNGSWQLQTITTEGITGKIKTTILNEADINCFTGSTWSFTMGNHLGYYSINKNGNECAAIKRNIRWSIYEEAGKPIMLQYKRVDDKYKDLDEGAAGFRFTIVSLEKNSMQLRSEITFENKPAAFVYNFIRL